MDQGEELVGTDIGSPAPSIEGVDIDGRPFNLKDLRGSYVIIDFWGSWCGPCFQEAPKLIAIHEEFAPKGLQIVSIAIEKNDKNWKRATDRLGLPWKYQLVEVSPFVRFNRIAADYGVTELPSSFLIDTQGHILLSGVNASQIKMALDKLN
jgi:thiol-disulfide isomerase/thioredoxin